MRALTHDQLRSAAPSIFAASPWERMSARYRMVPTIEVVDILASEGFLPVLAGQSRTRIEGKGDFTKHLIRFRRAADLNIVWDTEVPEVVMVNSHDGTAAYKFMTGVFRMVCSNGMISQSQDFGGVDVRHRGGEDFSRRIIDVTAEVTAQMPKTMEQVATFKQIALTGPQQAVFAEAALTLRDNDHVSIPQVLAARRYEDRPVADGSRDLWKTLNAVQENLVKGGIRSRDAVTGRRSTTRAIKGVDADVRTNKALWILANRMASLLS